MPIKIVRNDAGNCVNFEGSTNPVYWNACLSAVAVTDANGDLNLVNVINNKSTSGTGETKYEFFEIPYTEWRDEDDQPFASATEAAQYINDKADVTVGTGVTYKGVWDADTNTPDITTDTSGFNSGDFYKIIAAGTHDLGSGDVDFVNGDEVIFDGTDWVRKPFVGALIEYDSSQVLLNSNTAVYADAAQGLPEPNNLEQGWYFTNDAVGKKINWYFVGSQNVAYQITKGSLKSGWARVQILKETSDIFMNVYTTPQYDGNDVFWYRSEYTYSGSDFTGLLGQEVLLYWGETPTVHPTLTRVPLTYDNDTSTVSSAALDSDAIFSMALSTNSAANVGENEFLVKELGYKNEQYLQSYLLEAQLEGTAIADDSYKDLTGLTSDFKLDDTSTTIMLDNGYNYGANTIKAVNTGDGLITIQSIQGGITHFHSLDHTNVTVNGQSVSGGLNDVINTLNELFTVGAFESVVISDPYSTMIADVDGVDTDPLGAKQGSAIDPVGDDVAAGIGTHSNQSGWLSSETIDQAGEYFTFDIRGEGQIGFGLVHTTDSYNDGYFSGNSAYANPATFCNGTNSAHYGYQFSHWFHPSPDGPWTNYGANTGYSMREGWSSSTYGFRYNSEGADWVAGNPVKLRVGIDTNGYISIDYYDADRDTLWTPMARTSYPIVQGAEFKLGIKFGDVNARLRTVPKIHLLEPAAPTMYFRYIESPDGQYSYPLFATEEEANYYDLQEGGSGTSHPHLYEDDPTFTNWWMPDTNSVMNTSALPSSAQTFEGQTINWTEITTLTNAQMVPAPFSAQTITVNELSAVNVQLHPQDASYITSIVDTDNSGLTIGVNGVHLNRYCS